MRARDIIGLILALILAIGVAFLTRIFLTKEEKPTQVVTSKVEQLTRILVAGKKLLPGDKITTGDLVWQEWPKKAVTTNDLTEETTKIEEFMGSIVRFPIPKGNPIVREELVKRGDKGFLAAIVSPGKRAISIDVTASASDSGLIFPGDYVDVLLSITDSTQNKSVGKSKTILKNIKVLAFDTALAAPDTNPKTPPHVATLEVTPGQAEVLMAAVKEGVVTLSLHSIAKGEVEAPEIQPTVAPRAEEKIILMRGKEKSEIQFQEK
jgi:pilus assembly protein CpaB